MNRGIIWIWKREEIDIDEVLTSNQFWSLRLPLTDEGGNGLGTITFYRSMTDDVPAIDLDHLCGTLHQSLSAALTRILQGANVETG